MSEFNPWMVICGAEAVFLIAFFVICERWKRISADWRALYFVLKAYLDEIPPAPVRAPNGRFAKRFSAQTQSEVVGLCGLRAAKEGGAK